MPDSSAAGSVQDPIRVLLVDDHAMVRAGLRELLNSEGGIEVVAEAGNGEVGARLAAELRPDVVVMDLSMPVLGGAEATRQLLEQSPEMRVLVLSAHEDPAYARAVLGTGAAGYVLKRSACGELVRAIRAVVAGDSYIDPVLAESLLPRSRRSGSGAFPVISLSERELEVVQLVAKGHTAKDGRAARAQPPHAGDVQGARHGQARAHEPRGSDSVRGPMRLAT